MRLTHVLQPAGVVRRSASFETLARWWSQASPEARYRLLCAAYAKSPEAPPLEIVFGAALVAEEAQGQVEARQG